MLHGLIGPSPGLVCSFQTSSPGLFFHNVPKINYDAPLTLCSCEVGCGERGVFCLARASSQDIAAQWHPVALWNFIPNQWPLYSKILFTPQHCPHLEELILYFSRLTTSCLMSHHIVYKDRKVTYPHLAYLKACSPKATENNFQLCSQVLSQMRPTEFFTRDVFSGNLSRNCHRIIEA